jgi:hypothetical protein
MDTFKVLWGLVLVLALVLILCWGAAVLKRGARKRQAFLPFGGEPVDYWYGEPWSWVPRYGIAPKHSWCWCRCPAGNVNPLAGTGYTDKLCRCPCV